MSKWWRLAGSVGLLTFVACRLDWAQLGAAFARLDLALWGLAVAVYVVAQLVSSLRWQLLARPLGLDAPWGRYVALYFIGMFFNLVLPSSVGGDVVRAWYLASGSRRRAAAVVSVLADRGSGLAVLVVLACLAGLFVADMPAWMVGVLAGLAGATLAGLACLPLVPRLARWLAGSRRLGKAGAQLALAAAVYGRRPGRLAAVAALSVVVQLANVAQAWFVAAGLGLDLSWAYLAVAVPLVALLTLVPLSINGMGLREVGLVVLLAPAGVAPASAVTLSLLQFAATVAASLLGAVFYLGGSYPRIESAARPGRETEGRSDAQAIRGDSDQGRAGQPASAA